MVSKIYFDLDGVLADFDRGVMELAGFCKYRQIRAHCTVVECMLSGVSVHAFRYIVHVHKLAL